MGCGDPTHACESRHGSLLVAARLYGNILADSYCFADWPKMSLVCHRHGHPGVAQGMVMDRVEKEGDASMTLRQMNDLMMIPFGNPRYGRVKCVYQGRMLVQEPKSNMSLFEKLVSSTSQSMHGNDNQGNVEKCKDIRSGL